MTSLRPWIDVENSEEFQGANPEFQDTVRDRWLNEAFRQKELAPEEKVRVFLMVHGQRDPKKTVQDQTSGIPGFLGRGAIKAGQTALEISDMPFKPLHYTRENILRPALEAVPGLDKQFEYYEFNKGLAKKMLQEKFPNADPATIHGMTEGWYLPESVVPQTYIPSDVESFAWEKKAFGTTRGNILAHGAEQALTGQYIKHIIGNLAHKGLIPATQYVHRALQDLNVLEKWGPGKIAFETAGRQLHSVGGQASLQGTSVYNQWMQEVPEALKRKDVRDLIEAGIGKWAQTDPKKLTNALNSLDPGQKKALSWYIGRDLARRNILTQFKVIRNPYDDYVPHMAEELEFAKIGVLFQLRRHNKITLQEWEALGKSPFIDDIAIVDAIHEVATQRLLGNKIFSDMVRHIKLTDGNPAILTKRTIDRLRITNPEIAAQYEFADPGKVDIAKRVKVFSLQTAEGIDEKTVRALSGAGVLKQENLYVHKDLYSQVKRIVPHTADATALQEQLKAVLNGSRRFIMFNPLIHGVNITSTVVSAAPWGDVSKMINFFSEGAKIKHGAFAGIDNYLQLVSEAIRDGARIPAITTEWHRLAQDMLKVTQKKDHFWTPLTEANDRFLFDTIVSNPMYSMYKFVKDKWTPQIGAREAGKVAAEFVNTNQGALPIESMSPLMQQMGQWFLFSRSWTMSNFRLLSHAVGIPWGTQHLSPVAQRALGREWAENWSRSMAYFSIQNEMMNRFFSGRSSVENGPGHEMDVDINRRGKDGAKIYIAGSPFLFVRQMIKRAEHLAKGDAAAMFSDLWAPLNTWKASVEALANKDFFMQRDIAPRGAPLSEQLGRRFVHAAAGMTPFGAYARETMKPGAEYSGTIKEYIDGPEDFMRLFTYWPTKELAYHTEVFTRLKKADKIMILNTVSPDAKNGLIKGLSMGIIEGTAAMELKDLKDNIIYLREQARDKALQEIMRKNVVEAANILIRAGWTPEGARTFIITRGRKTGFLAGERE